jgi:hypothetical protein
MTMVGDAKDVRDKLIDPAQLPVDPVSCNPVYPHQYLQVNTIFEVAHAKGLHTAWTDKHPAYEILNGPSGYGIDDLFAPEINSVIAPGNANDWTKNNVHTQEYDTIKVLSVINEINGFDHSGLFKSGTPAIFGMNFQAVSTAQKLNKSPIPENSDPSKLELGGYKGTTPGPVLESALKFVDGSLKQMQDAIKKNHDTVIILSAKHGQSPVKRSDLTIINDGTMTDALNAAWKAHTPSDTLPLVAHAMDDDGVLLWLNNRSTAATSFAKDFLSKYSTGFKYTTFNLEPTFPGPGFTVPAGVGSDAAGKQTSKPFTNAGLSKVLTDAEAAKSIGVTTADERVPDVIGYAEVGSVYAKSSLSKIAEHGGRAIADRHVPIVVSGAGIHHQIVEEHVDTIQIAPTILHLLGLNPKELKAVQIEGTQVLPGLNY